MNSNEMLFYHIIPKDDFSTNQNNLLFQSSTATHDGAVRATLITKLNDPQVNSHNRVMIQHWHANMDMLM